MTRNYQRMKVDGILLLATPIDTMGGHTMERETGAITAADRLDNCSLIDVYITIHKLLKYS